MVETLAQRLNVPGILFTPGTYPSMHPSRSAQLTLAGEELGWAGELHPQIRQRFELPDQPVALLELRLDLLLAQCQPRHYQPIARFPAALEDLALVVDEEVPAQTVQEAIQAAAGELLRAVTLFDLYRGEPIPPGKKSLAYALTFQADDRSLTEDEVRTIYQRIQQHAAAELGATARQ